MTDQEKMAVLLQQVPEMQELAKALWGERQTEFYLQDYNLTHSENIVRAGGGPDEEWYEHPIWMWHLQQMVIADDPIEYLGKNI